MMGLHAYSDGHGMLDYTLHTPRSPAMGMAC